MSIPFEDRLKQLPDRPGVYLMKNEAGAILYIGKAKSLKNRVRSYFQNNRDHASRTRLMVGQVADFEYILTPTEMDALLLEANLVRQKMPKYNVLLKDDKHFPYLKVTLNEPYPRLLKVRRVQKDGARYFGPYLEGDLNRTLAFIQRYFPLRKRNKPLFKDRPCLNYQMGRCLAPCQKLISSEEYRELVDQVVLFLSGRQKTLLRQIKEAMAEAAGNLEYELAGRLRDLSLAVEQVISRQTIISPKNVNKDILGYAKNGRTWSLVLLKVREGRLVQSEDFSIPYREESAEEVMESFVEQRYPGLNPEDIPKEIILPLTLEDQPLLEKWLGELKKEKVFLKNPGGGDSLKLVQMANENAQERLKKQSAEETARQKAVENIALALGVKSVRRIEAFDISHVQGSDTVASMVVFEEGRPKKSDYRKFKIRTVEGVDDYSSMKEVVIRRYSKLAEAGAELPDLILIDGGKGQLNAAVKALADIKVKPKAIIGLAKEEEEIFFPGKPDSLCLTKDSPALHLIQQVRDEAHRFAVTFHRQLRSKGMTRSFLDNISGLGEKRKKQLLDYFGSVEAITKASVSELKKASVPGAVAELIYASCRRKNAKG